MRSRLIRNANLANSSCGGDGDCNGQEIPTCKGGADQNGDEDKESTNELNEEKEEDEVATAVLGSYMPATESMPSAIKTEMQESSSDQFSVWWCLRS